MAKHFGGNEIDKGSNADGNEEGGIVGADRHTVDYEMEMRWKSDEGRGHGLKSVEV